MSIFLDISKIEMLSEEEIEDIRATADLIQMQSSERITLTMARKGDKFYVLGVDYEN